MNVKGIKRLFFGKSKPRSQMCAMRTHDGRLDEFEMDVNRLCLLTENQKRGFLLDKQNLARDAKGATWQYIDENNAIPIQWRRPVNKKDFPSTVEKIWKVNREERERQNYRENGGKSGIDKFANVMILALGASALPAAIIAIRIAFKGHGA